MAMVFGMAKCLRKETGLTLVELIIISALFILIMSIVIPSVDSITGANLKTSASRLAGTIRYTYDLAARKNATFRVVLDLDEKAYWVESSSERFLLDREKSRIREGAVFEADEQDSRPRRFVNRSFIESGQMWEPRRRGSFSDFAGRLTPKVTLPRDISIQDAWVAHQEDRATAGRVDIYCFPTGMTEEAVVHLVEDEEDVYSLRVEALTGSVKVFPHYVEIPEE